MNRFIGCLHFGCSTISKQRGFDTPEEHDEHLIQEWNKVVSDKDTVYILGDVSFEDVSKYPLLNRLKGIKYVVMGNHDLDSKELFKYVEGNIHAHIHNQRVPWSSVKVDYWGTSATINSQTYYGYYNVDAEAVNYKPILIKDLVNLSHGVYNKVSERS